MFKRVFVLSIFAVCAVAMAQVVTSNMAPVVVAEPTKVAFDLKVFIQQILTNGGLVLLMFLAGKIPVAGPFIVKILDVLVGNPKHK